MQAPTGTPLPTPDDVHRFWFGDIRDEAECARRNYARWFERGRELDAAVRQHFAGLLEAGARGELDGWQTRPRDALALILTLDQFSRHVHRGHARAFANDARAARVCLAGIDAGLDERLLDLERLFFYLPLEHAEDAQAQERSVALNRHLADTCARGLRALMEDAARHAVLHRDIVVRFGRFPHRNEALGRESTPAELAFLAEGAARFGQ